MILAGPHFVFGIVKAMVVKWGVLLCRLCSHSSAWIGQGEVLVTYRVLLGIWKHSGHVYLMLPGRAVVWLRKASKRHLRSACLSHLLVQKWFSHPYMLITPNLKSLRSGLWEMRDQDIVLAMFLQQQTSIPRQASEHITGTFVWLLPRLRINIWSPRPSFGVLFWALHLC